MEQPDFVVLSNSFETAMRECSKIPNLPILTQAQQMERILAQLTAMQQDNRRFQIEVRNEIQQFRTEVRAEIQQLRTEMRQDFERINHRIDVV